MQWQKKQRRKRSLQVAQRKWRLCGGLVSGPLPRYSQYQCWLKRSGSFVEVHYSGRRCQYGRVELVLLVPQTLLEPLVPFGPGRGPRQLGFRMLPGNLQLALGQSRHVKAG